MNGEQFKLATGINVVHVPYKGGVSQYTIELISGYIDFASLQLFNVAPLVKQGKLRALGITARERSPAMPELATFNEQGVKFENYNWNGVLLPAKVDAGIVAKLNREVTRIIALPDVQEVLLQEGGEIVAGVRPKGKVSPAEAVYAGGERGGPRDQRSRSKRSACRCPCNHGASRAAPSSRMSSIAAAPSPAWPSAV